MRRLFAVLLLAALVFAGTDAQTPAGCPAEIARGRQLIAAEQNYRSARCVYGPATETACGANEYGWGGVPVRKSARRVVCVFDEPLIPEINGGGN
jgi:hypothetical protein